MLLIGHSGAAHAALAPWLAEQPGLTVCHPSGSVPQLMDFATQFQPHVVLLDVHGREADMMFEMTAELGPLAETLTALAAQPRTRAPGSMEPAFRGASHVLP